MAVISGGGVGAAVRVMQGRGWSRGDAGSMEPALGAGKQVLGDRAEAADRGSAAVGTGPAFPAPRGRDRGREI